MLSAAESCTWKEQTEFDNECPTSRTHLRQCTLSRAPQLTLSAAPQTLGRRWRPDSYNLACFSKKRGPQMWALIFLSIKHWLTHTQLYTCTLTLNSLLLKKLHSLQQLNLLSQTSVWLRWAFSNYTAILPLFESLCGFSLCIFYGTRGSSYS